MTQADVDKRMGLLIRHARPAEARRLRSRHRGRVREHGHQEGGVSQARRHRQAGRDPRHQHLLPECRRDRLRDEAAGIRHRPALLLAGQRDAAARNRARRKDLEERDRDLHAARAQDRQDRRARRRLPRFRRQPHAGAAPARGAEADPRRRDAVGRRPRALRFRHADGAVRDERSRRPRHRLVEGDVVELDDPRNPLRDGSPRAEDRRRLLRLRREPQRQALAGRRKDHSGFRRRRRASIAATSPTRKFWSAASIR